MDAAGRKDDRQEALERPSGNQYGGFGAGVALSADGKTALIGGDRETGSGAWVFTRSGETWTQQGGEITGGGQGKDFGAEVALSGDGNTALVEANRSPGVAAALLGCSRALA